MFNRNSLEKLVHSLESLTFRDRILEVIKLGKKEANQPEIANLINDLQQSNHYHRLLALYSCYGSYNGARVLTAIKDDSRSIRHQAIDRLHHLEITLAASEDEKIRRLALSALLAQTTSRLGWNQERIQRLLAYRQDSSVLVAAAAQFTFPPDNIIMDQ
jgi:hypothetical protein